MLGPIILHVALGVLLVVAVWGVGMVALRLVGPALPRTTLVHAYPVGLFVTFVASAALLIHPWLGVAVLALVVVAAVPTARELRALAAPLRSAGAAAAAAFPGAAAAGAALAFLLHGPTAERDSHAFGDVTFYVANQASAAESLTPFRDLLAEGSSARVVESGTVVVGAALSRVLSTDPFLFNEATLPVVFFLSLAIGFGLLGAHRTRWPLAIPLLVAGLTIYPTALAESPPVMLALPLGFSVFVLSREKMPFHALAALVCVVALDLVLTKGFGLLVLAAAAALGLRHHRTALSRRQAAMAIAGIGAAGVAAGLALLPTLRWELALLDTKFLPLTAYRGLRSQLEVRSVQELAPACQIAGQLLLALVLWRERLVAALAVLVVGIAATWFVSGTPLDIAFSLAALLTILALLAKPGAVERERVLLTAAAGALVAMAWSREVLGLRAAAILLVFFAIAASGAVRGWTRRRAIVAVAAGAAVAVFAITRGITNQPPTLTPGDYLVWHAVHDLVPETGLVFTSLTGPDVTAETGWNYYPGIAARQVYLGGWANGELAGDRDELRRRLASNAAVLRGHVNPRTLRLARRYDSFFAVVRRSERVPGSFRRVYANSRFALYAITARAPT